MGEFTFVWQWVVMDLVVLILGVWLVVFIVRKEAHPVSRLMEFLAFVLLNAAVFENFATLMGWYGYGRSLIMIFNVPLSVPVMEYIVVYLGLRLADAMKIPEWTKPVFVGCMGALTDFSLDPLAVSQRFTTLEGTIGRWTWFPGPSDIQIFAIPVYNFTGWILLCGYSTIFLILGRKLLERHPQKRWLEIVYPIVGMLLSLGLLMTPISNFLLWMEPIMAKGSVSEIVMLGLFFAGLSVILIFGWKGRMARRLVPKEEYLIPLAFTAFHVLHLVFTGIGGYWEILPLTLPIAVVHLSLIWFFWYRGTRFHEH
jgi:hypothetical protein